MADTLEILDALPGCGKTTALFKYMANDTTGSPWLYLSPMKEEIDVRVEEECIKNNMQFYIPCEDKKETKTAQILKLLESGVNIACTHALMLRFTKEHIDHIIHFKYNIVCDEELSLINGYNIAKSDYDFLLEHKLLKFDKNNGQVSFQDDNMSIDAKYGEIKQLCDMGCLFSAKRSERMMVSQLSTKLIRSANRFIVLSYNYTGSIMHTFMQLHGINSKPMDNIELFKSSDEIRKKLSSLIEFVETHTLKSIQIKCALSKSWWTTKPVKMRQEVFNAMASIAKATKVPSKDIFFTMNKDSVISTSTTSVSVVKSPNLSKLNFIACNVRATNKYAHKTLAIHAYTLHPNTAVKSYMQDMGFTCNDDTYALNMLLQWLFRGCIRNDQPMKVAMFSGKMNKLLKDWLHS